MIKSTMFVNLRQGAINDFYSIGKLIGEGKNIISFCDHNY